MMSTARPSRSDLIAALNRAMRDASGHGVIFSQAVSERIGVNSTDLECLDFILTRGPLTAGELATATGLTTGAITGVIDRLEAAGFARRERDTEDRRKVLVRIVPAAIKRLAPLFAPMERHAMAALEGYSDKELAFLLEFLNRLLSASNAAMAELNVHGEPAKKSGRPGKAPVRPSKR